MQSPRFDREQLVLVTEVMLTSALEVISSRLPHNTDKPESSGFVDQACWQAGWNLSILYAQVTGDGMGEADALFCAGQFQEACKRLVDWAWRNKEKLDVSRPLNEVYGVYWVDCHRHAEHFVNEAFDEYLG